MGAWGTGPLTNDDAHDLLDEMAPLNSGERVSAVMDVFVDLEEFHLRHRDAAPGTPRPDEDDGSRESLRAIAAAWIVAATMERVERPARSALLAGQSANVLLELATAARRVLDTILADAALAANWHHNAGAWTGEIRRLHAALAPDAPTVPAGPPDDIGGDGARVADHEDLDDPATLQRHNWIYRSKMLLILGIIAVAAYAMR